MSAAPTSTVTVRLWTLALPARLTPEVQAILTSEEFERAERSRARSGTSEWAHGRAALRTVLARECGCAPEDVRFERGDRGKPCLAHGIGPELEFSYARSGAVAMIALARRRAVGVDVERVRAGLDERDLARAYFDDRAREQFDQLRAGGARDAFFRAWVEFEARAKATGVGIVLEGDAQEAACIPCLAPSGYVAAVAAAGSAAFTLHFESGA